jgi:hypothetical protein
MKKKTEAINLSLLSLSALKKNHYWIPDAFNMFQASFLSGTKKVVACKKIILETYAVESVCIFAVHLYYPSLHTGPKSSQEQKWPDS